MADVIYAKLEQLHQMACSIGMVLKALQAQVKTIDERGGEDNVLEKILVNGTQLFPDREKAVRMTIPTKISDLDNDKKFQENVIEQVLLNGTKMPVDSQKRVSITIPTGTNNLVNDAGYQTNADVLAAIKANAYVHPSHTAYGSGLYKIVVDNLGHVTSAAKAVKSDITALGIPGQDTVYTHPKYTARGTGNVFQQAAGLDGTEEGEVGQPVGQILLGRVGRCDHPLHLQLRELQIQLRQQFFLQQVADIRRPGDPELSLLPPELLDALIGLLLDLHHLAGTLEVDLPGPCGHQLPVYPVEERPPGFPFQLGQTLRHGRLAQMGLFGRFRQAARLGDEQQIFQCVNVHDFSLFSDRKQFQKIIPRGGLFRSAAEASG